MILQCTENGKPKTENPFAMSANLPGVFAVQCPNPRCRKFMLVEEQDRNNVVVCLLCKTPIRIANPPRKPKTTPPPHR
jgi:hypothetical protein